MTSLPSGWRDIEMTTKDGRVVATSWANLRLSDDTQVGIGIDITERKQAEAALRRFAQRFRRLVDAIPQIVWIDNDQGYTEYVNERWVVYTGIPVEASLHHGMRPAIHPDDLPVSLPQMAEALQKGEAFELELRLGNVDGVYRWHLCRSVPIHDEEGKLVQWFGTATDIDERKRAEMNQDFLIALGAEMRGLFDPDAIIWTITSSLGAHLHAWRCTFHELEPETAQIIVHPDWRQDGAASVAGVLPLSNYSTPELRGWRSRLGAILLWTI